MFWEKPTFAEKKTLLELCNKRAGKIIKCHFAQESLNMIYKKKKLKSILKNRFTKDYATVYGKTKKN
jgi:hypothetical protein